MSINANTKYHSIHNEEKITSAHFNAVHPGAVHGAVGQDSSLLSGPLLNREVVSGYPEDCNGISCAPLKRDTKTCKPDLPYITFSAKIVIHGVEHLLVHEHVTRVLVSPSRHAEAEAEDLVAS